MASGRRIGENAPVSEQPAAKAHETGDGSHCFRCGRDLGPLLEWKKMDTASGPICYVCFNRAANDARREEDER
jgi:hypothetical protein